MTNAKKIEHLKNCIHCGKFVPRNRWEKVVEPQKYYPCCADCKSAIDTLEDGADWG